MSTHYIVAFDQNVLPLYYSKFLRSPSILSHLDSVLEGSFNDETDYVSVVGYALNRSKPSIEEFVLPYTAENKKILWYRLNGKKLRDLFPDWHVNNGEGGRNCSMQSMAKPYAVMETRDSVNASYADRTVLIMVTDEIVNGTDDNYQQEWTNVFNGAFNKLRTSVFDTLARFNGAFSFDEMNSGQLRRTTVSNSYQKAYQIIPYEVVATNKPSIYSVTDFPSPLPLRRVCGGYEVKMNIRAIDERYEIKDIVICNAIGDPIKEKGDGDLCFFLKSKDVAEGDTLTISMSLLFKDGLYNGTLLSPLNENYATGMSVRQVVRIPDDAKVLGIVPLGDAFWWWFPHDVVTAVAVWDLVILLVLIVVVGCVFYNCFERINKYVPDDNSLEITNV